MPSDEALLKACQAGDRNAWEQLLTKYERLVYSIPLNHGLGPDDAADIAQHVFTLLLQSVENLRPDSNLGGWLATVTKRHTWRVVSRRKRIPTDDFDSETAAELLSTPATHVSRYEMLEWLNSGLNAVGERCRQLLEALYLEPQEPSYAEIAERLKIPSGSIGPTRARCLQKMKEILQERAEL